MIHFWNKLSSQVKAWPPCAKSKLEGCKPDQKEVFFAVIDAFDEFDSYVCNDTKMQNSKFYSPRRIRNKQLIVS